MRTEKDDWLSDVLGVSSWKVLGIGAAVLPAEIRKTMLDRAGHGAAFFSAKIPTRDVAAVTNATRAGFSVVDVNVTFDWEDGLGGNCRHHPDARGSAKIESATADDASTVEAIAGHNFVFSRFHLDPAIGQDRANEVKRQWARNSCQGRASAVYVARQKDVVTGFLTVLESKSGKGSDAIIDLVGVGAEYQGQGIGQALCKMFIEQWRPRSDRLRVGTQISNIPAIRLYESIGFRVTETSYVLHAHANHGALAA